MTSIIKSIAIPVITVLVAIAIILTLIAATTSTALAAGGKEITLNLGGKFCEFYPEDITAALQKLPGVKSVDAVERRKFVIVKYEDGKVTPQQMVTAIGGVKEEGKWHCEATVK